MPKINATRPAAKTEEKSPGELPRKISKKAENAPETETGFEILPEENRRAVQSDLRRRRRATYFRRGISEKRAHYSKAFR